MMKGCPFVFAGPSLYPIRNIRETWRVNFLPPVARNSISELVSQETPGLIIIADGVFHSTLSVGHAEIRDALDRGWEVHGVSSMGAIRAAEMAPLGMIGHGKVFERFRDDGEFDDDEVALLHTPKYPYYPGSEPLVHTRSLLEHLVSQGVLSHSVSSVILKTMKNRWFGYRTIDLLHALLSEHLEVTYDAMEEIIAPHRIKQFDLLEVLKEWKSASDQ